MSPDFILGREQSDLKKKKNPENFLHLEAERISYFSFSREKNKTYH